MDDLISRQAAIEALRYAELGCELEAIEALPSAQPTIEERKRGEWIEAEVTPKAFDVNGIETWASKMQCDQCGFITYAIEGHMGQYNFCPNCGADMRGKGEK